jgi:ech hydrogenase subunit F
MFKMTPNIMRNLVVKKSTRMYPAEVRQTFDKVRGELINDIESCILCGTCAVKCPSQCIAVDKKAYTWTYDPFACVYCGVCVDTCPVKSLSQKTQYRRPTGERLIMTLQGQPRKKDKAKDKGSEKETPPDPEMEKDASADTPEP